VASHPNRWRIAGVFLDDATIGSPAGVSRPTADNGVEEFVIAAPVPGCSRKGLEDGKAEPIILYRLFLDPSGPLN
jgi:hypothetical protein